MKAYTLSTGETFRRDFIGIGGYILAIALFFIGMVAFPYFGLQSQYSNLALVIAPLLSELMLTVYENHLKRLHQTDILLTPK